MYWTLELASKLDDAPWPATKDELLDYANRSILDIWPEYPTQDEDFFFDEEEY